MSEWKINLREASFRGVPFFVDTSDFGTGRRSVTHEFPDRDIAYTEDLGRKSRSFQLEGHVLGDDYFDQRDALISACEEEGPGELIHPYLGAKQVQCGGVAIKESMSEGRMATFTFSFFEAGEAQFPRSLDDKKTLLLDKIQNAIEKVREDFKSKFGIIGFPGFIINSANDVVQKAIRSFEEGTRFITDVSDTLANLTSDLQNLKSNVQDLLNTPDQLADQIFSLLGLLKTTINNPTEEVKIFSKLTKFGDDLPTVVTNTATREKEKTNQEALRSLIVRASVIEAVHSFMDADFVSLPDAERRRNELSTVILEQIENTDNDELFQAMVDLNTALIEVFPDASTPSSILATSTVSVLLPNITHYLSEVTLPSLAIVYDLFEDFRGEEDLVQRNRIRHPGFVPGGIIMEIAGGR